MKRFLPLAALVLPLLILGCAEEAAPAAPVVASPAAWRLASAPAGAVPVAQLKTNAQEGDRVTMTGRIGGRMEPVSPASGLLVVMDPALPSCAEMPDDHCSTLWDYCCETPEDITANAATVQLRDAAGEPIVFDAADFEPLSTVTVTGTVGPRPDPAVLVVLAEAIHVTPG